jgi:excisionase family DNA binding protein
MLHSVQEMHRDVHQAAGRPRLLTTRDVQDLIRVDRSTIYRMAETGRLPAIKVGRQWRFPEDRLHHWLDQSGPAAGPAAGLDELIGPELLQAVSALLGEMLGVMFLVTDMAGRPLVEVANPCGLFAAAHRHPGVLERCVSGWREMAAHPDLEPHWMATPLGFLCARTLVRVGDQLRGMLLVGGVAPPAWPPGAAQIARLAAGLGVAPDLLAAHVDEVFRLRREEQDRVVRLLPRLGALLSRLAGSNGLVGNRAPGGGPRSPASGQRSDQ